MFCRREVNHRRLMLCASSWVRDTTWAPRRRSRPRRRPCKGEREIWPSRRNWVELVFGPGSTRLEEKLSPCIACTTSVAPFVRSRVFLSAGPSATMARRSYRASCSRLAKCCPKSLVISSIFMSHTSSIFRYTSTSMGWPNPNSSCWGTERLPSGTASLSFRDMLEKPQLLLLLFFSH